MRSVVDTMVISQLAQVAPQELQAVGQGRLVTSEYVATQEVAGDAKRLTLLSKPWLATQAVQVGGPGAELIAQQLPPLKATINDGEISLIALAFELQAPFVTADRNAYFVASAVLGSARVILPYELWLDLEREQALTGATRRRLAELTWKNHKQLVPVFPRRML